jgi:hypothetical protein
VSKGFSTDQRIEQLAYLSDNQPKLFWLSSDLS